MLFLHCGIIQDLSSFRSIIFIFYYLCVVTIHVHGGRGGSPPSPFFMTPPSKKIRKVDFFLLNNGRPFFTFLLFFHFCPAPGEKTVYMYGSDLLWNGFHKYFKLLSELQAFKTRKTQAVKSYAKDNMFVCLSISIFFVLQRIDVTQKIPDFAGDVRARFIDVISQPCGLTFSFCSCVSRKKKEDVWKLKGFFRKVILSSRSKKRTLFSFSQKPYF